MEQKQIVVLGAGFGGVYTFKRLRKLFKGDRSVKISLVNNTNYFLFTPLLHEVATGNISPEHTTEPIRKVLGCCDSEFYLATVSSIDPENRFVKTDSGEIKYDYLVVALGSGSNFYGIPGAQEHCLTLKSLDDAINMKNHFISSIEKAATSDDPQEIERLLNFVVIGGGPTGVELTAEMSEFFYDTFSEFYEPELISQIKITLVQKNDELLPYYKKSFREKALKSLRQKHKVDVKLGCYAEKVNPDSVEVSNCGTINSYTKIWVAGIKPNSIPFESEVRKDRRGCLTVNGHLQLIDYPEIYAIGDNAFVKSPGSESGVSATAQAATKEAKIAAENIYASVKDNDLVSFVFDKSGDLVSLGKWKALAEIHTVSFSGTFAWWLWRTIYLTKVISFTKKLKIALDWTLNIFSPRDVSQI